MGPRHESAARAEEEDEGSARGQRQSGNRQSSRKVRLKGRSQSASRAARQEGRTGSSVEGASRSTESKERLKGRSGRRKPTEEAGRQIRKRSSRRKLTNSAEGEADQSSEGASRRVTGEAEPDIEPAAQANGDRRQSRKARSETQVEQRAGQQNRSLSRRCKLTTRAKMRPEGPISRRKPGDGQDSRVGGSATGASRRQSRRRAQTIWRRRKPEPVARQNRTRRLQASRRLESNGWPRRPAGGASQKQGTMTGPAANGVRHGQEKAHART